MTRLMFDAITPSRIPATRPEMVAGYVNGKWPSFHGYTDDNGNRVPSILELFPEAIHVSIAVSTDADAQVLDIENMDASPGEAPAWAVRQRERGQVPSCYMSQNSWDAVREAFHNAKVAEPCYWVANYDNPGELIEGASAVQYHNTPGYDLSIVADEWPGIGHSASPHTGPIAKPTEAHFYTVQKGDTLSGIAAKLHVADWHTLYALNHAEIGNDPNLIQPGLRLLIPGEAKPPTPKPVRVHYITTGETLTSIADAYGLSDWHKLYDANRSVIGSDPNTIFPGQRLVIP